MGVGLGGGQREIKAFFLLPDSRLLMTKIFSDKEYPPTPGSFEHVLENFQISQNFRHLSGNFQITKNFRHLSRNFKITKNVRHKRTDIGTTRPKRPKGRFGENLHLEQVYIWNRSTSGTSHKKTIIL